MRQREKVLSKYQLLFSELLWGSVLTPSQKGWAGEFVVLYQWQHTHRCIERIPRGLFAKKENSFDKHYNAALRYEACQLWDLKLTTSLCQKSPSSDAQKALDRQESSFPRFVSSFELLKIIPPRYGFWTLFPIVLHRPFAQETSSTAVGVVLQATLQGYM